MEFRVGTLDTPKGRAIIERLNPAIASLSSIQRRSIVLEHTSRKLYKYDLSDYLHRYGLVMLLVALLFIALITIAVLKQRSLRLEHEKKLRELVDYDQLTGALSISGFRKRVEELLRTYPDTPYFLSYNNIRDFKFINDSYGREAGDAFLKFWVAKSMEFMTDEEAIGRVTSDRFAVLRRIENEEKIRADEKNVIEPVENYFINQGKETRVQMCSGIYILTPKDFRKIDVDRIKLDLRFLSREGDPEKGRIIISSIIKMVRPLGMKLIAEGVETVEQADFLQSQGSSEMQGYYFYKPMSVTEFEKFGIENETTNGAVK